MKTSTSNTASVSSKLSRVAISKMTASELLIELARRGLKLEDAKQVLKGKATCPHCDHTGPIESDFGVRIMRGAVWPQSWCRKCRGTHD